MVRLEEVLLCRRNELVNQLTWFRHFSSEYAHHGRNICLFWCLGCLDGLTPHLEMRSSELA